MASAGKQGSIIKFRFLAAQESVGSFSNPTTFGSVMVCAESTGLGGTDLAAPGIIMVAGTKGSLLTGTNLFAIGIIVICTAEQPRTAFADFLSLGVIVVDRAKQTRAAGNLLLCNNSTSIKNQILRGIHSVANNRSNKTG